MVRQVYAYLRKRKETCANRSLLPRKVVLCGICYALIILLRLHACK